MNAIASHHEDQEAKSIYASSWPPPTRSAPPPGPAGESLDVTSSALKARELAKGFNGVSKAYAFRRAGRSGGGVPEHIRRRRGHKIAFDIAGDRGGNEVSRPDQGHRHAGDQGTDTRNRRKMRILFIGDIMGSPGAKRCRGAYPPPGAVRRFDFVIANCENAAAGKGITKKIADELFGLGFDGMPSGNHIWDSPRGWSWRRSPDRPPGELPGRMPRTGNDGAGEKRQAARHGPPREGFSCPPSIVPQEGGRSSRRCGQIPLFLDFHAEATSEKKHWPIISTAGRWVIGTHTMCRPPTKKFFPEVRPALPMQE